MITVFAMQVLRNSVKLICPGELGTIEKKMEFIALINCGFHL